MRILMPVAGDSTRFPGMKPKWLLTHPNGNLMFHEALAGLRLPRGSEVVLIARKDHERRWGVRGIVARQASVSPRGLRWRVVLVDPTRSQPETVAAGVKALGLRGPVFVKDCDNRFACRPAGNAVAVARLGAVGRVDPAGKSYAVLGAAGRVERLAEKEVVSDAFCVGGYGFSDAREYLAAYRGLAGREGLYLSHVIDSMVRAGARFTALPVTGYCDWGTLKEWDRYKRGFATLLVDLDGTVVRSSAGFFKPFWGETGGLPGAVEALNRLQEEGRAQVILTTSRPLSARAKTQAQLRRLGLRHHSVVYGLLHARRVVVNDYAATNPYPSAEAMNLPRDSEGLAALLTGAFDGL